MKRTRHTPEQIVRKLREADRLLAENTPLAEVMRSLGVSYQTYQRWRSQYAAMRPDDVARLKTLEKENARLKRLLAEKELDNDMTPCSPRENGDPESKASGRCAPRGRIRGFAAERVWWSTNTAVLNVTAPPAATKNRPYESASGPWRSNTPATATRAST